MRVEVAQRRQPDRDVAEQLGARAAGAAGERAARTRGPARRRRSARRRRAPSPARGSPRRRSRPRRRASPSASRGAPDLRGRSPTATAAGVALVHEARARSPSARRGRRARPPRAPPPRRRPPSRQAGVAQPVAVEQPRDVRRGSSQPPPAPSARAITAAASSGRQSAKLRDRAGRRLAPGAVARGVAERARGVLGERVDAASGGRARRSCAPALAVGHEHASAPRPRAGSARRPARSPSATSAASVTSGGTKIAMIASTTPDAADRLDRAAEVLGAGGRDHVDRVADDGLGGQEAAQPRAQARRQLGDLAGRLASHASAHRIPGPPALVTIATRLPRGADCDDSSAATSNSSPSVSVRITPAWRNSASTVTSEAASSAPGVRRGRARAGRRAAALDRDDRLGAPDPPRDPRELARVAERLEVHEDHVGVRRPAPSTG